MKIIYTLHSLSRMLQVSTRTLRREMEEGHLSFVRIRGRLRFRQEDVSDYLTYCSAGTVTSQAKKDEMECLQSQSAAG